MQYQKHSDDLKRQLNSKLKSLDKSDDVERFILVESTLGKINQIDNDHKDRVDAINNFNIFINDIWNDQSLSDSELIEEILNYNIPSNLVDLRDEAVKLMKEVMQTGRLSRNLDSFLKEKLKENDKVGIVRLYDVTDELTNEEKLNQRLSHLTPNRKK